MTRRGCEPASVRRTPACRPAWPRPAPPLRTCARAAFPSLTGTSRPRRVRRTPRTATATCAAGSELLSPLVMSARSRRTFLTSTPRPELCCFRKLDPTQAELSQPSIPTSAAVALPPEHLRVLLLRRLRLPLPLAPRVCRCRGRLDPLGDHRSACATSGVLASRALPLEHAVAPCLSGGRRARCTQRPCRRHEHRRCCERRAVHRGRRPRPAALARSAARARCHNRQPGHARRRAAAGRRHPPWRCRPRRRPPQTATNLPRARECATVGGRFGAEAASFLRHLARHRAASLPPPLRAAACAGWVQRWSGILAVAAMRAFAASLLELPPGGDDCDAGVVPDLHEVLAAGGAGPLLASRLPAS